MKAEKTEFKVQGIMKLRDGTVVLTGVLGGPRWEPGQLLDNGQRGTTPHLKGDVKVEIVGAGGLDRDIIKTNMQMVHVKILQGDVDLLRGATLIFE